MFYSQANLPGLTLRPPMGLVLRFYFVFLVPSWSHSTCHKIITSFANSLQCLPSQRLCFMTLQSSADEVPDVDPSVAHLLRIFVPIGTHKVDRAGDCQCGSDTLLPQEVHSLLYLPHVVELLTCASATMLATSLASRPSTRPQHGSHPGPHGERRV